MDDLKWYSPELALDDFVDLTKKSSVLGQCVRSLVNGIYGQDISIKQRDLSFDETDKESITKEKNDILEKLSSLDVMGLADFVSLFKSIGDDLERSGNSFVEVLTKDSKPFGLRVIKGSIEISEPQLTFFDYPVYDRDNKTWTSPKRPHFFKIFKQIDQEHNEIYFKEVFDPRVIDRKSGQIYTQDEFNKLSKKDKLKINQANSLYHFKLNDLNNGFGLPRWANCQDTIRLNLLIEQNNSAYYSNAMKSDLVISSTSGLSESSVEQLKQVVKDSANIEKARSTVILTPDEFSSSVSEASPKIDIRELNANKEGQFLELYKINNQQIISSCGLHPINIGLTESYNKATAEASLRSTEEIVFEPSRQLITSFVNSVLFPLWDVKYHVFSCESSTKSSTKEKVDILKSLMQAGLTIKEIRNEIANITGIKLTDIKDDWISKPMMLAFADHQNQKANNESQTTKE